MSDVFTPEKRSAVMRRVKGRDTSPEIAVRRILRAAGIGYRLGGRGLPGKPDIVMKGRRTVVFVHGCFWHRHDCARGSRKPKQNADYWTAKIGRNMVRDADVTARLTADGWRVITVWECDLKALDAAARLVAEVQAATISTVSSSEASPARTWSRAPSRAGGVKGLETK
ncbi:very short patch repair endonuclease [Brevundimonas sp. NIBR11]|uniref:very short patch repair endonuclease n=1 Tax=Brevundimonas sp. NIBR11 TaxID=3015999 RepID=UPI0022F009B6|nr:very short patch repair endonuclease [Brevundimonas sp. NIBR11]